ncbi:MAG: ABC transporter permease [Nocardioidaceae bacterium]
MTSNTELRGNVTAAPLTTERVPFGRLVKVELRKLVDTRAGKWLLIAIALITVAVVIIFALAGHPSDMTFTHFVAATGTPQGFLLPVLGILAVTSEWSQRTGLVTFTLEPSRTRVLGAKFVALIGLAVGFVVLALAVAALGNLLGMAARGGDGSWAFGVSGVRDILVLQLLGIVEGFAFGMLFMNSAAAIVLYFVLPTASSILFNLVTWLQDHLADWLDLGTTQSPLQDHSMNGSDWAHLAVTTLIWVILPLVLGYIRVLRSEVKSS